MGTDSSVASHNARYLIDIRSGHGAYAGDLVHENFGERYGYVAGYGKPIFIAEFGATGSTSVEWLSSALADMANFPLLQAAVFFNAQDPVGWGANFPAPDWRVDPGLLAPAY